MRGLGWLVDGSAPKQYHSQQGKLLVMHSTFSDGGMRVRFPRCLVGLHKTPYLADVISVHTDPA